MPAPSQIHDSIAGWLSKTLTRAARARLISDEWEDTMEVLPGPEYEGFIGNYAGRKKAPDTAFCPVSGPGRLHLAEFPAVVLETGHTTSTPKLFGDAALWRDGSNHQVKAVIVVKFYPPNVQNRVKVVLTIFSAYPRVNSRATRQKTYTIFPAPARRVPNPSIPLNYLYAGRCPGSMSSRARLTLDLELLRNTIVPYIHERGNLPA
ncbi:hypothetical protein B9Z19DRAFT_1127892 [Tuber borchii]|uniref:Uncharacterized protein n=1 Tax=Tuber borchii TaxID=42251 RepID=A0A2T6ZQH2_TUBBO|nr:hypothetical protein B9Z19DRAFT_1127892 [Tuber borchii]